MSLRIAALRRTGLPVASADSTAVTVSCMVVLTARAALAHSWYWLRHETGRADGSTARRARRALAPAACQQRADCQGQSSAERDHERQGARHSHECRQGDQHGLASAAPDAIGYAERRNQDDRQDSGDRSPQPAPGEQHQAGADHDEAAEDDPLACGCVDDRGQRRPADAEAPHEDGCRIGKLPRASWPIQHCGDSHGRIVRPCCCSHRPIAHRSALSLSARSSHSAADCRHGREDQVESTQSVPDNRLLPPQAEGGGCP